MAKQAKNDDFKYIQKSLYLPKWIWKRLEEVGRPKKHSYSNTVELILQDALEQK